MFLLLYWVNLSHQDREVQSVPLTFIAEFPGCLSVLKVAMNDVFTQDKFSAEFTVTCCPRVEMFSSNGQSGQ